MAILLQTYSDLLVVQLRQVNSVVILIILIFLLLLLLLRKIIGILCKHVLIQLKVLLIVSILCLKHCLSRSLDAASISKRLCSHCHHLACLILKLSIKTVVPSKIYHFQCFLLSLEHSIEYCEEVRILKTVSEYCLDL